MEERNGSECDDQSIQGVKENLHGASLQLVQIRRNLHVMKKTCFFFFLRNEKKNIYIYCTVLKKSINTYRNKIAKIY